MNDVLLFGVDSDVIKSVHEQLVANVCMTGLGTASLVLGHGDRTGRGLHKHFSRNFFRSALERFVIFQHADPAPTPDEGKPVPVKSDGAVCLNTAGTR